MPSTLTRRLFSDADLTRREIRQFYCGTEPWARKAAVWIRRPASVAEARALGTDIWLYETPDGVVVGYGSLGPWRTPESPPDASIIPMLAIRQPFHGEPSDQPGNRYSDQIIRHLVAEAASHAERRPLIGLYVNPANNAAIKLYQRHHFDLVPAVIRKDDDGVAHMLLVRRLPG